MRSGGLAYWIPLLARFFTGQLGIHAINLVTGFLILRFLSIEEYAVYILASLLQSLGSIGSDLGVSQAVVSIGAPIRDDRASLGALVRSAVELRKRLFAFVVPVVLLVAYVLLRGNENRWEVIVAVTVLSLAIAWVQQSASIATATLNSHHDSRGLVRAGLAQAVGRLALVATLCSVAPYAVTALAVNLLGAFLYARMLWRSCAGYLGDGHPVAEDYSRRVLTFVKPLLPGVVYYLVQGQIATFLLAWVGATVAVAEVGALGRLGQIIALFGLLNGFFIQPYFARITSRRQFALRAVQVGTVMAVAFGLVTVSAFAVPEAWLAVLGPNYEGLANELAILIVAALLSVSGGVLYTIVVSTEQTKGQWWQIVLGLGAQMTFIFLFGVENTRDALMLNLMPAATYAFLQIALVCNVIRKWNHRS